MTHLGTPVLDIELYLSRYSGGIVPTSEKDDGLVTVSHFRKHIHRGKSTSAAIIGVADWAGKELSICVLSWLHRFTMHWLSLP